MTIRTFLLLAPAGAGKTAYAVTEARRQAQGLEAAPYVLVASALQAESFRRRLAHAGGAIGVRVLTFEQLYELCLNTTDAVYSEIDDSVQHRVLRSVVRQLTLQHYAPLTDQPGFVQVLKGLIDELKAGQVHPESFAETVAANDGTARLQELADIYTAYQARLQAEGWADTAGRGWLAVRALERGVSQLDTDWPLLLVDGFDDFTPVQLAVLRLLADRVERMVITLTGTMDDQKRSRAHRRFDRTRRELVEILSVERGPLPCCTLDRAPVLIHLEAGLFESGASQTESEGTVDLIEAVNRAEEVRAALRWLKTEVVERGISPGQLALLARDVQPYRPFVRQTAAEFGLPVHIYAGEPLDENPAVAGLIDLLRLMLPIGTAGATEMDEDALSPQAGDTGPALPPRLVTEAWRSPYFDWSAHCPVQGSSPGEVGPPIGIEAGDADALGAVARRGRVIAGLDQWEAAFEALESMEESGEMAEIQEADEAEVGSRALSGQRIQDLHSKFQRFIWRLTPPKGRNSAREFVRWLEDLIGPDPARASDRFPQPEAPTSLGIVARVRAADDETVERDLAALRCLKKALRGLVWAEEVLDDPPMGFPGFLEELISAAEATFYRLPLQPGREEILVADAVAARGVPFKAVAVLGLAEGFFPASQSEDPLLWDADREELQLSLEPSTQSAEAEYFYETIAAPSERILLTRPRLADDGAPWEASPFWEEIQRLVDVEPTKPPGISGPPPDRVASWPELLQSASASVEAEGLWAWLRESSPESLEALDAAVQVFTWRQSHADSAFDGSLYALREHFSKQLGADYTWSASRLERYRTCPFFYFVSKVLNIEPREEPTEGINRLQRGKLYHEILERVYQAVDDPTNLDQILTALPAVAGPMLDEAPERYGFRRTAWWAQTREEVLDDLRRSLETLSDEELRGDFVPTRYEAAFGLWGQPPLVVPDPSGQDAFQLRGLIDRVDRDAEGRVRIIDYKTGGSSSTYGNSAIRKGENLQLPLYALAARDALGLGRPLSGFYWHVQAAEPSQFKLENFGPEEAIRTAVAYAWEAIRSAREGKFTPGTDKSKCPPFCPAASFCWHFKRGYRG